MTSSLEGKIAVVTGGASGIGEACVRDLAARGARVVIADLDVARAEAVAASIEGASHTRLDVTKMEEQDALAERLGAVDIVVTSAGVLQRPLPPESLSMAAWDHVVAVDQRGVYMSCIAFGNRMAKRGRGVIINIASIAGIRPMPLHSYVPAKAAVIAMTEALAAEWGRSGVRVNAIAPGFVLTPALQAAVDAGERDLTMLAQTSALGRLVGTHEIAKACSFLASDDASAITGVTLPVDAGWLVAGSFAAHGGLPPSRC